MDTTSLSIELGGYTIAVIPSGAKGTATLSQSAAVQSLLQKFENQGRWVGVICAGSLAIKTAGLVPRGRVMSHSSVETEFTGYEYN